MSLLLFFVIIALFGKMCAMEKSQLTHMQIKDRKMLNKVAEKIPDLEKEKYSNILLDFLGPYKPFLAMDLLFVWYVEVPLDQITVAKFECKSCGNYKYCELKHVNGAKFDGVVQFHFYEYDKKYGSPHVKIHVNSLHVADYTPQISGSLI